MKNENQIGEHRVGAYIHIPFCEHICYYCDFNKVFLEGQPVDEYIAALLKEIQLTRQKHPNHDTQTIYIGGGTPTSLSVAQLEALLSGVRKLLPFNERNEFTVEANPGDLTQDKLKVMKEYGVNRLSMGVQTFDNHLLKKIGRKHTAVDVYTTMQFLEKENFQNVSIDLIYALPGQSMESFSDTLRRAIDLDLPHYSLYSLILENKTMFMNWVRQGRLQLPDQELEAAMFAETIDAMEKANRHQYEVSNFATIGNESQHNLLYWNNEQYYGFGAGASGYLGHSRYRNHGPIQHYLTPLKRGELPIVEVESLSITNQMEEEFFLGLRKKEGVSIERFLQKFGVTTEHIYGKQISKLIEKDLLIEKNGFLQLTEKGLFVGNDVFEAFLIDAE